MPQVVVMAAMWAAEHFVVSTFVYALIFTGSMAYSAMKSRQAKAQARDAYNAAQVDRLVNITSAVASRELALGRVRKGGAMAFKASTGQYQKDLYLVIALAGHEIDGIEAYYLNDQLVNVDGNGNVTDAPYATSAKTSASQNTGSGTTVTLPANYVVGSVSATTVQTISHGHGGDTIGNVPVAFTQVGLVVTTDIGATVNYQVSVGGSNVKITAHLGGAGQTADADLLAAFPADWASANVGQGVAYVVAKLNYSEASFPSGAPNLTVVLRGAKLYDPRTGLTAWSENPALMMRYVYAHPKFGKASITAAEDARIVAAANACDISTTYTVGGVAQAACALYRASLVLPYGAAAKDAFDDLSQAMGGSWAFAGGELYLKAGVYTAPVMTLVDDDLAVVQREGASESQKQIGIAVHKERAQKFNTVKVKIWDQGQNFKQSELTPLVSSVLVTRDGVELVQEVTFPAIGYAPQALHVAGIMMRDARDPLTVELPFKLRAYPLELFDTVSLTLSRYGWAAKTFQILGRVWNADGSLAITVKETSAAITQMDSGFSPQGFAANTNLPKPWEIGNVGTLTVTSGTAELVKQIDGTVQPRMRVSWAQVTDISVQQVGQIEVQYREVSSTGAWTSLVVPGNETSVVTAQVQSYTTYIIRARTRTKLAVSDWGTQVIHQVIGETAPPTAPVATATGGMFKVRVSWTFGDTRNDIRGVEVWWSATNDRATAARLTLETYPALAYDHVGLSAGQGGYYWVCTVDTAGNASAYYPSSATAGLYATASTDPSALLTQLTNSVGLGQMAADLAAPIGTMSGADRANAIASLQSALSDYDLTNRMLWQEQVTNATITVDPVTGKIMLLATANVTTDVQSRLTAVEVLANATSATLTSTVSTLTTVQGNLTSTMSAVSILQGQITTTASTVYVDNSVAQATGAITSTAANAYTRLAAAELQSALDAFAAGQVTNTLTASVAIATDAIKTNADAVAAQAKSFAALVSTVAGSLASITTEQITRAAADAANASSITTIAARLDTGDYAAVKTSATASANAVGVLNANYTLKVDTNGHVAGYTVASGGGTSSIVMLADKFAWVMETAPGSGLFTAPKQIMALGMVNGVATLGLDGSLVVDGSISARSINGTGLSISAGSTPAISGTTMTGAGAYVDGATGRFALGNATANIVNDGTKITINGFNAGHASNTQNIAIVSSGVRQSPITVLTFTIADDGLTQLNISGVFLAGIGAANTAIIPLQAELIGPLGTVLFTKQIGLVAGPGHIVTSAGITYKYIASAISFTDTSFLTAGGYLLRISLTPSLPTPFTSYTTDAAGNPVVAYINVTGLSVDASYMQIRV